MKLGNLVKYSLLFKYYGPSFHEFRITKEPQQSQQDEMTKDSFLGKPENTTDQINDCLLAKTPALLK